MAVPTCPSQPLMTAPPLPGAVIAYSGLFESLRPCERWSVVIVSSYSPSCGFVLCHFPAECLCVYIIFVSASSLNFYSSQQETSMSQRPVLNHNKERLVAVHCTLLCDELASETTEVLVKPQFQKLLSDKSHTVNKKHFTMSLMCWSEFLEE